MVFTTTVFLFYFLPVFLTVYFALPRRFKNGFLCAASYVFYGWWNPWFVLLMFGTTVVDYGCGKIIAAEGASDRKRKVGVALSIVSNVALLAYFKYSAMGLEAVNAVLGVMHRTPFAIHALVLPVGLSFYTFQSMSYAIDLYRGQARPARSLLDFMTYVSLFPHLVAGPIVRYHVVSEQIRERRETGDQIARGVAYFIIGFAKKIVLANPMGDVADAAFGAGSPPWDIAVFGLFAYSWQLYFDFSGYSDMAVGIGHVLGFQFPENFNSPYRSKSFTEVWSRWHISLSTWLRENLYHPLAGGPTASAFRKRSALFWTMVICGLWHGAHWRYVLWGAVHGTFLVVERTRKSRSLYPEWFSPRMRVAATFGIIQLTWCLFRCESLHDGWLYFQSIFALRPAAGGAMLLRGQVYDPHHLLVFAASAIIVFYAPRTTNIVQAAGREVFHVPVRVAGLVALFAVALCEMWIQSVNPFLYFQF